MRLFKVTFRHYAPKDSEAGIKGFLLRETEEEVCDFVMTKFGYMDDDDLNEEIEVHDEDYNYRGQETRRDSLLRSRGQIGNEHSMVEDAHYGVTHLGWEDLGEVTDKEAAFLRRCGLLADDD